MNKTAIEKLKKRHQATNMLEIDCTLAYRSQLSEPSAPTHLAHLQFSQGFLLPLQPPHQNISLFCMWGIQPSAAIAEDGRSIMKSLMRSSDSKVVVLHSRFDSQWRQVSHTLLFIWLLIDKNIFPFIKFLVDNKYCEQWEMMYNCDSRSGELQRFLAVHKIRPMTVVYLATNLRHSPIRPLFFSFFCLITNNVGNMRQP